MERDIEYAIDVIAPEKGPAPQPLDAIVPEEAIEETVAIRPEGWRGCSPARVGNAARRDRVGPPSEDVDPRTGASWRDLPQTRSMAGPIVAAMRQSRGWGAAG